MGGQELEDATNGIVTRSYIANLRKGRIGNPGYEKLAAIAKAMDFSPGLWFEDVDSEIPLGEADKKLNLAERINRLFETVINEKTGAPHTNAEVARMSLGDSARRSLRRDASREQATPPLVGGRKWPSDPCVTGTLEA